MNSLKRNKKYVATLTESIILDMSIMAFINDSELAKMNKVDSLKVLS